MIPTLCDRCWCFVRRIIVVLVCGCRRRGSFCHPGGNWRNFFRRDPTIVVSIDHHCSILFCCIRTQSFSWPANLSTTSAPLNKTNDKHRTETIPCPLLTVNYQSTNNSTTKKTEKQPKKQPESKHQKHNNNREKQAKMRNTNWRTIELRN